MVRPYYVQRCTLEEGKLRYDYMGSSEFEGGDQARALRKLFKRGMKEAELTITAKFAAKKVTVFLVVPKDFDANDYLPHLQGLADDTFRLQEPCYFDRVVNPGEYQRFPPRVDVWFDFTSHSAGENIVLWTLSRENQRRLTAALKNIKNTWAAKS